MKSPDHSQFCFGVLILAAGSSQRMGRPKLLLPWRQGTVLAHLLAEWRTLGSRQTVVVHGPTNPELEAELDRLGVAGSDRVMNSAPSRGMFSSIQAAARWQGWSESLTHIAISLGDQPHLRRGTLSGVLGLAARTPNAICQPARSGKPRHPVLIARQIFFELCNTSATTLKEFLARRAVTFCESDDPGLDLDMDSPEDYQRALALQERSAGFSPQQHSK
ncbi:MAG: nucleotidyltransferase family protein [Limisphaerales bacterium]